MTTREGLIWAPSWSLPTDSGYGKCSKLASLSSIGLRALCQRMFGGQKHSKSHGRSLLDTDWCVGVGTIAEEVYRAGIRRQLGDWGSHVARFDCLRYCPACINEGFHSILCQVDAIALCPAHGLPLITICRGCHRQTAPPIVATLENPFRCTSCGVFLGDEKPRTIRRWACQATAESYANLLPHDALELQTERLLSSSWISGDQAAPGHPAERILNFRVAMELGEWRMNAASLDPAVGAILARRIDPWRVNCDVPMPADWHPKNERLGIDVYANLRSAYIATIFEAWRERYLDSGAESCVSLVYRRLQTKSRELGRAAAVARLDAYISRVRRCGIARVERVAPFATDVLDPLGWHAFFGLVVEEEIRKAGRWRTALRKAAPDGDEYARLLAVYAEPYVPGPLGVCVWASGQKVVAFMVGNAFGERLDWYGFTDKDRVTAVSVPRLVKRWRRDDAARRARIWMES